MKNYAFIDSQNLNLGILKLGWKLDFLKFRIFLKHKFRVEKAYLFVGYLPENQDMYRSLQESGYVLVFKPVLKMKDGRVKGNVDAEMVLQAMIDYQDYDRAVIVSSDGDFQCLVRYLFDKEKLEILLSPDLNNCSILLKKAARGRIAFMNNLEEKLGYKK